MISTNHLTTKEDSKMRKTMGKLTQGATRLAALALALLAAGGACGATALRTTYDSSSSAKVVIDNYYNNTFNNCNTTASGAQITIPSTGSITQIRITSLDFAYLADVGTTKDHAPSAISITVDGVEYKSAAAVKDTTNKMTNSGSSANDRMVYSFAGVDCILAVGTSYNLKFYNADGSEKTTTHRFKTCDANGAATIISGWNYNTTYVPLFEFTGYAVSCVTLSGGSQTLSTLSGWDVAPQSDTADYVFSVTDDTDLSVDSAKSATTFTFDVTSGKTLTLTGNTLTASEIAFTGEGVATTQNMSMFSGTLTGDGTLCYDMNNGTTKPSGIVCTSDDWAGMLWIKNGAYTGWNFNTAATGYIKYGSANSTLRLENVTCFLNATETVGFTLDLHGEGLKITNGNGYKVETVKKLTGSGTLAISGGSSYGNGFIIQDGSEFAGSINITTGNYVVNFADSGTYATSGKIIVGSGKTATVASGKTWSTTNQNGIEINGTLTLADSTSALTGAISGSGTLVANQQFPVPGSSFTGTLTINAAAYPSSTDSDTTAIYGSTLNVASGVLKLTGNVATWPTTVNISSGAYLWIANTSMESLALTIATFEGMLYLEEASGLTSLSLDIGSNRSLSAYRVALPSSATLATVNLKFDEVKGEGGTITLTNVSGIPAVEGRTYNFTVNCLDGRTVAGTYDSATSTITYTPSISGAATDIDWDFTDGEDDALEQAPSGVSKNADSTMTFYTDATDSTKTGVYIKHHPYITGAASFMGNNSAAMTVAVVGTMPATSNTIFLNVGSAYAQQYGLVFLTTANANEVLIGYNYGGTVTPITTMTVPNSSTARHSYIVTKVDGSSTTTFTVYLDGIKWKTVTTASKIAFASSNSGVQVGSDFGGNIRDAGTYSAASDDVGVLNVLRVYGRIITEAEIAVYASTFPYVSPNGASSRTFATAAEDWVEATDTDWTNTDSSGTTTQGTTPSAGASVTVTADVATEITVNLASDTQYEALTINGSATTLAANSGSGKISVTGMTVIGAPVTVEYGAADFTGGPMTITEDGSITFDYSGYDISAIYTTTDIPLTSDVDEDSTKVFLTVPTATYQTATLVYTSGHYAMHVTPVHEAGTELYYKSGYWSSTESSFSVVDSTGAAAPVFPGDVVVIDSTHATVSAAWVADTFPANVTSLRIATDFTFHSGVSAAIFGGVTVAVDEGVALTLNNSGSQNSITLGAVTLNGPGSVAVTDTIAVSGAVSGTAALTISGTVNVAAGGSVANAVAGSGTITYAAIPAVKPSSFTGWTGTVQLPAITSGAIIFNNYGTTGSTVYLTSMSSGAWIQADNTTIDPKLYLAGNMTLSVMSPKTYTFAEIDGPGALSFATSDNQPTAINITKVAEGYSGMISSTLETPVTIATLDRAAGTTVTPGSKVLSTSSGVQASALTVGGVATGIVLVFDTDGLYVKAASVTKNDATTYHNTVADALTAAGSDAATITLLAPTDNAITIAPGQTLVNGNLTTGGVTGPNGYEVVSNNGTYTLVDNTASTWSPGENSDNNWATAANWSTGYLPSQYTVVTFPASESAHVVKLTLNNANSEAERHRCASMVLNGDVMFQRGGNEWAYVFVYGNVTGTGTLTFEQTGLNTPGNSSIAISCPVVGNAASNDNFFSGSGATYTFSAAVDIAEGEFKADYANLVFNGPVTIRDGGYVKSNGAGASATFNGGIIVPKDAAASLTLANNGGPHTIASTVTLGVDATLTIPNSTVTNDATFVASAQGYHVVSTVSGATTVYSVEAIPSSAEIGEATFEYGVDFTNATVTVAVTETNASGVEYTLAIGGKNYTASAVGGTTVTFNNVEVPRGAAYGSVSYNITSTASATTGATSGSAAVADVIAAGWINENATTHGLAAAGGAWTNAEAVSYSEGKAAISDNRFAATTASTASRVVLEFEVCFSSTSEDDVSGEAQAAIKLGAVNDATTFMVLTTGNTWTPVSNAELPIDASATYDVVLAIDYGTSTYKVDVEGKSLTNSTGSASFSLATNKAAVQNIDFVGSGTLTSMKGDQLEGYMVKDALNHFYATIEAATQAYNSANGPYIVLHDGTAPSGWKIDNATKKLIKIAKGLFFMAY